MARLRGSMKRPFRIRQKAKQDRFDAMTDDDLLGDGGKSKKNARTVIAPKQKRTGNTAQAEKYLQKIQQPTVQAAVQQQDEDIWAGCQPSNVPLIPQSNLSSQMHSAYSYNPDRTMLIQAQREVAHRYLNDEKNELQTKLNTGKAFDFRDNIRESQRAFLALAGREVDDSAPNPFADMKACLSVELQNTQLLSEELASGHAVIDNYVQFWNTQQAKKEALLAEIANLEQLLITPIDAESRLTADRQRSMHYEQERIYVIEELELCKQLLNIYSQSKYEQILDYKLPLESELKGSLRQIKAQSGTEEQFIQMKRQGKFDELGETAKFDKIMGVVRKFQPRKGELQGKIAAALESKEL